MTSRALDRSITARRPVSRATSYFAASRAPRYSLVFALPLLLAYQALAAALGGGPGTPQVRNGADVMLAQAAYLVAGPRGPLILITAIILLCVGLVWRDVRRCGGVRPIVFLGMLGESLALALLLGGVVGLATVKLLGALHALSIPLAVQGGATQGGVDSFGLSTKLMLSLGAGLYEELLFRVLLVGALAAGARIVLGLGRAGAGVLATIVGALVFSAFHYVGRYGDPFTLQSFVFRALSGVVFSVLYLTRGFGITAWTHALYDVMVMLA